MFPEEIAQKQHKLIRLVYHHGKSVREEFQIQQEDPPIWISANFMPIQNDRGKVGSILCISRDGKISKVVPMCPHIDNNEHSVQVVVTEQGLAAVGVWGPRSGPG